MEALDETFTYGGWLLVALALCGLAWLALRAYPSFDAFVRGFDDELHLSDTPAERARDARWRRVRRFTLAVAVARRARARGPRSDLFDPHFPGRGAAVSGASRTSRLPSYDPHFPGHGRTKGAAG